jgi:hypothetical protein
MNTQEIKGNLARLLATENLLVEHKQVPTASFDVEKRVLTLPLWKKASDTVYTMLVGHEVGHALYTPNEGLDDLPCPKSYVNVTEDARIEKLMKRKFPGLTKDFYGGYQELNAQDFFCIKDEKLELLPLIDRVNLHYKIGAYSMMPFEDSETPLRDAVGAAETFAEAIAAADAIYEFTKQQREEKKQSTPAQPQGAPGNGSSSTEESTNSFEQSDEQQGQGETPRPWFTEESDKGDNRGDDNRDPADLDTPSYEYADPDIDNVTTQRNFDRAAESLIDRHAQSPTYVQFPKIHSDKIIVNNKQLWDKAEEYWDQYYATETSEGVDVFAGVDSEFNEFCNKTAKDVNYLVKEFECKKSASAYARSSTSRTGVLDTTKLHNYKFSDDIFKKVTRTTDGKNHGLVFLLDWSGSMSQEIFETVCQVINLVQFCKKVGIPFDVYSFVSDAALNPFLGCETYESVNDLPDVASHEVGQLWIDNRFKLVNLLTSEGNQKDFKRQCRNMYRVANYWHQRNTYYKFRPAPPYFMGLGGTPLNEALVAMHQYLPEWQTRNGVEKSHLIILTDGESQCIGYARDHKLTQYFDAPYPSSVGYNTVVRHKGRYYSDITDANQSMTNALIRIIRDSHPNSSVLGFRICNTRGLSHYLRSFGLWDTVDKYTKVFKRDKSVVVNNSPYNELYVIQSNSYSSEVEMDVNEDATKSQIRNAFKKTLKSKSVNRKMLSSFAGRIA